MGIASDFVLVIIAGLIGGVLPEKRTGQPLIV